MLKSSTKLAVIRQSRPANPSTAQFCNYSPRVCMRARLDGYEFCIRHILEDKNSPYKQCTYVSGKTNRRCTAAAPRLEKRDGYAVTVCAIYLQTIVLQFHLKQPQIVVFSDFIKELQKSLGQEILVFSFFAFLCGACVEPVKLCLRFCPEHARKTALSRNRMMVKSRRPKNLHSLLDDLSYHVVKPQSDSEVRQKGVAKAGGHVLGMSEVILTKCDLHLTPCCGFYFSLCVFVATCLQCALRSVNSTQISQLHMATFVQIFVVICFVSKQQHLTPTWKGRAPRPTCINFCIADRSLCCWRLTNPCLCRKR